MVGSSDGEGDMQISAAGHSDAELDEIGIPNESRKADVEEARSQHDGRSRTSDLNDSSMTDADSVTFRELNSYAIQHFPPSKSIPTRSSRLHFAKPKKRGSAPPLNYVAAILIGGAFILMTSLLHMHTFPPTETSGHEQLLMAGEMPTPNEVHRVRLPTYEEATRGEVEMPVGHLEHEGQATRSAGRSIA